jgi:hypothetical protein
MTNTGLSSMNGSSFHSDRAWLRQSVQQFFKDTHWNDRASEVLFWMQTTTAADQPLSLTLKVRQFFEAVNWDGSAIGSVGSFQPTQPDFPPKFLTRPDPLTLDDFSNLF